VFEDVALGFAENEVLRGVSFRLARGETKALFGVAGSGEKIWCATPFSLFSVDLADNSIDRLSRMTGLSETGISAIQYDSQASKLIIAYNSSNIDILSGSQVFNIPDIRQSPVAGSKRVYNILATGNRAYLSTGLGVIVLGVILAIGALALAITGKLDAVRRWLGTRRPN